jgi:hypothetical protein
MKRKDLKIYRLYMSYVMKSKSVKKVVYTSKTRGFLVTAHPTFKSETIYIKYFLSITL